MTKTIPAPPSSRTFNPAHFDRECAVRGFTSCGACFRVAPGFAVPAPSDGSTSERLAVLEQHRAAHRAARQQVTS